MTNVHSIAGPRFRQQEDLIVVTGGARGIGKAIATRLVAEGARVAIFDVDSEAGNDTASTLAGQAERARFLQCDVTKRREVEGAVEKLVSTWGPISGLVNNAGIGLRASFLELPQQSWDAVIGVNLTGAFIVAQEVCREMAKARRGAVVNMASAAAHMAHSDQSAYSVSKAGLEALTRAMAFELAPLGIRTNAVAPGTIQTEFLGGMLTEQAKADRVQRVPLGRLGMPQEVAATVTFLLSEEASYLNGSIVAIDGGLMFAGIRTAGEARELSPESRATPGVAG